jgi:signal peptidase II
VGVLLVAAAVVAADRATKEIALRGLPVGRRRCGFLRVVVNERPLLARGTSLSALVTLWVTAVACAIAAVMWAPALRENALVTNGVVAALAGALCNLGDRLFRGSIVDFMAIGRWPVFNLADVAILGGAALAGASLI